MVAPFCIYREGFTVSFLTATADIADSFNVTISPSPVADMMYVNLPTRINEYRLEIYNSNGQLIIATKNQNEFDVQSFPTGIYYLKIITPNHIITKSFVKQ